MAPARRPFGAIDRGRDLLEDEAIRILGERADDVLHGPCATLGPPWSKDHRMALAATIVVT